LISGKIYLVKISSSGSEQRDWLVRSGVSIF
jgi:hypothetical protein